MTGAGLNDQIVWNDTQAFPDSLTGKHVHMIGIKGTGMCALAELLVQKGVRITGSDSKEKFYTDEILASIGITIIEEFSASNVSADTALVVYSSAYSAETNPELQAAISRSIPSMTYPQVLGLLSSRSKGAAVSGVHGKTTTTAMAGTIIKRLGLEATTIAGSQVFSFGNRSVCYSGDKYLIAETCEYRRNFLSFKPSFIIITSVELDHPDYFSGIDDIYDAFVEFGCSLPDKGILIFCADDKGALNVVNRVSGKRGDIRIIPYGLGATGDYRLKGICSGRGSIRFMLDGFPDDFEISVPGVHSIYDAIAAITLAAALLTDSKGQVTPGDVESIRKGLLDFRGSKRRTEVLGEAGGILFIDDYGHHPTAILTTLRGIREFYPDRRLVVDFMPHTFSRTRSLLAEFASCFSPAHAVVLHKIYASARETEMPGITGKILSEVVAKQRNNVFYYEEPEDSKAFLREYLKTGDIFLTMGAGDNWKLGKLLYESMIGLNGESR